MRNRIAVAMFGLALMAFSGELRAQDDWVYEITPALWTSGGDGTASYDSPDGPISIDFDELGRMEAGFAGTFQAQRGRWGYLIDTAYGRSEIGDQDWAVSFVTGGATYQLSEKTSYVNFVFGARYGSSGGGLRVEDPTIPPEESDDDRFKKLSSNTGWADLMVGLQLVRPFGDRWAFEGYVDAGAGGSNLTYQVVAGLSYRFSPGIAAKAGYRLIGADVDDDSSESDLKFGGLYAGVGFKF